MAYANHNNKDLDIAVFGASGFTGRLVAEYLSSRGADAGQWAMVGRNKDKLEAVRAEIGAPASTELLIADADNREQLTDVCRHAKVVLTTVGPYQLYGDNLIQACVETGTDYVDLCGEPNWMHEKINEHQNTAKENGARIVFSCGFDSIPSDLGVLHLQNEAKANHGGPASTVKCIVRSMKGTFSGGTAASFQATMASAFKDPSLIERLKSPFALTPNFAGPKQPSGAKPLYDEEFGLWMAPFIMAAINTKNVHRTNFLSGHSYGENFVYSEMMVAGKGDAGEATANAIAGASASLLGDDAPKPGEGPDRNERENGSYDFLFIGAAADGTVVKTSVIGDRDPGYGSTSKMISEAALCLIHDCDDKAGGITTPGATMGTALIERLQAHAGLTFAIE